MAKSQIVEEGSQNTQDVVRELLSQRAPDSSITRQIGGGAQTPQVGKRVPIARGFSKTVRGNTREDR